MVFHRALEHVTRTTAAAEQTGIRDQSADVYFRPSICSLPHRQPQFESGLLDSVNNLYRDRPLTTMLCVLNSHQGDDMPDPSFTGPFFSTVFALLGGYGIAYLRQKGERDAINDGFDKVVSQTRQTTQASEDVKRAIERINRQDTVAEEIRRLQQPLVEEATRILVRISERFHGKFNDQFSGSWIPDEPLIIQRLSNKRDTTIYRFMRFFASYRIYRQAAAGLPACRSDKLVYFYVARKIEPVLASGGYPSEPVLWRDVLIEMSDQFCIWSEKWKGHRPLSWEEFARILGSTDAGSEVVRFSAERIAEKLLQTINPRLALIGIYMIDLVDEIDPQEQDDLRWTSLRQRLVLYLRDNYAAQIYLYSQEDGINDLQRLTGGAPIEPASYKDRAYPKKIAS